MNRLHYTRKTLFNLILLLSLVATGLAPVPGPALAAKPPEEATANSEMTPGLREAIAQTLGDEAAPTPNAPFFGETKLTGAEFSSYGIGGSIAIDGETAVIGNFYGTASILMQNQGGPDNWGQVAELSAPVFVWDVAIDGDVVVIAGWELAYVFERDQGGADNWGLVATLSPTAEPDAEWFGYSAAISGDVVAVGTHLNDAGGSVHVYARDQGGSDNWGEVVKITHPDNIFSSKGGFGASLALSGDTLIVGAYDELPDAGVYIFERDQGGVDNWGQVARMEHFPWSVALEGVIAVRGGANSAYVHYRDQGGSDNWGQVAELSASDIELGDGFGYRMSISGDTVVVGSPDKDDDGTNSGAAYIFGRNQGGPDTWGELTKLTASDAEAGDLFGFDIAVNGDTLMIGALWDDDACISNPDCASGAVYRFDGASSWAEAQKILPDNPLAGEALGHSVAIDGDTAVAGAIGDGLAGPLTGAAYIFERDRGGGDAWGQARKIIASDLAAGDTFGFDVSISGDIVAVSAYGNNNDTGAVYLFERNQGGTNNWGEIVKLTATDGAAGDFFGWSVSIQGDTVIVGSPFNGAAGAAYIFDRDTGGDDNWGEVVKLTPGIGDPAGNFGSSVAVSGDTVVVGDHTYDPSGAVYMFERDEGGADNWGEVTKLLPGSVGYYAYSVSLDGDTLVVGGSPVSVYERNEGGAGNWGLVAELTGSDTESGDGFGSSVSISGDIVVAGANHDDDACPLDSDCDSGSAYVFSRDEGGVGTWGQLAKLNASDAEAGDYFGISVSVSGNTLIIGSPLEDGACPSDPDCDSGAAYAYEIIDSDTITTITSDDPDPSVAGESVTIQFTVTTNPPGSFTPTGTVTVTDNLSAATCSASVAAGQCDITLPNAGSHTLTATYAGDSNFTTSSDTESHTVNQADTTTAITSDTPDPSVAGEAVTVQFTVTTNPPGSGTPTGTVTVTDSASAATCSASVAAGQCDITLPNTGSRTLTATYVSDANFTGSSGIESHTVNQADTTTAIAADNPDPSMIGKVVTVTFTVTANPPGSGTPTGTVTVTDSLSAATCAASVAVGQCDLTLPTAGTRTLTATYAGDANFNASSGAESHTVDPLNPDTIGVYDPSAGRFKLRNTNDSGPPHLDFTFAPDIPNSLPLTGDWDGDGIDTIGLFDPLNGEFHLRNSNDAGPADLLISSNALKGAVPIAGDWDGDGVDTVGIYKNGQFLLRNSLDIGPPDLKFPFGAVPGIPLTGDWDGDGVDTIGLYHPASGEFQFRNTNDTGPADITLSHDSLKNVAPLTGDWDGDGLDTLGVYRNGTFYLRNTLDFGPPDLKFTFGGVGLIPLAGDWDG